MKLPLTSFAALLGAVALAPVSALAQNLVDYRVQPGDSCPTIARRLYGDPGRIDLIHANNALGRLPHRLRPGTVLRVPRVAATPRPDTDALVTFVRNRVDAFTPTQHRARTDEPLTRGHRVGTNEQSSAEVTFQDESQLQLGEQTLVVILGRFGQVERRQTAADTVLERGVVLSQLAALTGRAPAPAANPPAGQAPASAAAPAPRLTVQTAGGATVGLTPGSSRIAVDEHRTTRVSVYRGQSTVRSAGRTVSVPEGFGSRAEAGRPPAPPRALPTAPTWSAPVPPLMLLESGAASLRGTYAAGPGAAPVAYHVELARDARFNDSLVDRRVPAQVTNLEVQNLASGLYRARVSAIDAEGFEGPSSEVQRTRVAHWRLVPGREGQRARFEVDEGVFCGLDGAALAVVSGPLELSPERAHTLRCALDAQGTGAIERTADLLASGPLVLRTRLGAVEQSTESGSRELLLRVTDAVGEGQGVPTVELRAAEGRGLTVEGLAPLAGEPGTWRAMLRWQGSLAAQTLTPVVNGVPREPFAVPRSDAPVVHVEPARRLYSGFDTSLGVGPVATFQTLGVGMTGWLETRYRYFPGEGAWAFTVGLRAGYEYFACSFDGRACPTSGGTVLPLRAEALALALPIGVSVRVLNNRLVPYAQVLPRLWAAQAANGQRSGWQVLGGVEGLLGLQVNIALGGPFAEVGYRYGSGLTLPGSVSTSLSGLGVSLGWRVVW